MSQVISESKISELLRALDSEEGKKREAQPRRQTTNVNTT